MDHIDSKRATFDCGIIANFIQDNWASALDTNLLSSQLDYYGTTHDIIEVGFRCFTIFILDVKWFKTIYNGPNATVRRDASGFFDIDSTKWWTNESDTFVLPQHCEQVRGCSLTYDSHLCFFGICI